MANIWRNRDGAVVHLGGLVGLGGDTGLPPNQIYYCGRQMNQCRCGQCDGVCGPTNGCPCNACKALLRSNGEGAVVHFGTITGIAGDLGLPADQVFYCGRKMDQCRCGRCNGICGPNDGCPCDSCRALLRRNGEGAVVRMGGDDPNRSQYGGDTGLPASQVFYCGRYKQQCRCGRCDGRCGPSNGCPCDSCKALLYTNDEGAVVHLGNNADYGAYCGDTGLFNNQVYYCSRWMHQCRCGKCDGQCGPTKGCPCSSCKRLLMTNSDGIVVHQGVGEYNGGDTGVLPKFLYYCGRKMNQCRCGKCDGTCGPTNGCPCDSCVKLVSNSEGAVVHLGSGYYGGDTGLHPRQIYYCGRRKNQCRCRRCDGRCGPTNGCPCNSCKLLLPRNSENAIVHLGGGFGSGGDTGLPPNQVYYCGRRMDQCRCGRCSGICGPSSGCPCDSCKLMAVQSVDPRTNGQSQGQFSGFLAFSKAMSLDAITAMVSIDSDLNLFESASTSNIPISSSTSAFIAPVADSSNFNGYNNEIADSQDSMDIGDGQAYDNRINMTPSPTFPSPSSTMFPLSASSSSMGLALTSVKSLVSMSDAASNAPEAQAAANDVPPTNPSVFSSVINFVTKFFSSDPADSRLASVASQNLLTAAPAPASAPDPQLSPNLYFELCTVCMDQFRDCTIVHGRTGHVCCCYDCALLLKQNGGVCPTCKAPIQMVVKYFFDNYEQNNPKSAVIKPEIKPVVPVIGAGLNPSGSNKDIHGSISTTTRSKRGKK